jgi:predicted metal-dependent phosphoesterase TrpH
MKLPAFDAPGSFYRGNLHTHSNRSDGALTPETVCAHYRDAGYDFLALTDHFTKRYEYPIVDTRPFRTNRFTTILGAELHAPQNSHGEVWHILSVGLPQDFAANGESETGPQLAARAVEAGAFVAIAHPHWSGLTVEDGRALPMAHAAEIYNHTCALENARGGSAMFVDALLDERRDVSIIATDDAHFKCDDSCGGWVMVKAEANEPEALLQSLKAGHFYSSQGPEIRAAEIRGDMLEVECSPVELVAAVGRGTRSANIRGSGLTRAELPLRRFAGDWFRLVVTDNAGRSAWSNPVRLPAEAP